MIGLVSGGGVAGDLLHAGVDVPQRQAGLSEQAGGVGAAPLGEEVVVGATAFQAELGLRLGDVDVLPAATGVGEDQLGVDAHLIQHFQAGLGVAGGGMRLRQRVRVPGPVFVVARPGEQRRGHARLAVHHPDVVLGGEVDVDRGELHRAARHVGVGGVDDVGYAVTPLLGDPGGPEILRLRDVGVDVDHLDAFRDGGGHGKTFRGPGVRSPGRASVDGC